MTAELQHLGFDDSETAFCGHVITKRVSFVTEPVCPECVNREALDYQRTVRTLNERQGWIKQFVGYLDGGPIGVRKVEGEIQVWYLDEESEAGDDA